MTPDDKGLPEIVAPPLCPAASPDVVVADLFEVEWTGATITRKD